MRLIKSQARSFGVSKFSFKSEAIWILIFSLLPLVAGILLTLISGFAR